MRKMVIILDLLGVDAHLVAFMLILLAKRFLQLLLLVILLVIV